MPSPYAAIHDTSSTDSVTVLPHPDGNRSHTGYMPARVSAEPNETVPILTYTPPPTAGDEAGFPDYNRHYSASVESHMSGGTSIGPNNPFADIPGSHEPFPAWSAERQIPMSTEEIEDIFLDLAQKFGFQKDSMRNMVRFFTVTLTQVLLSHSALRCQYGHSSVHSSILRVGAYVKRDYSTPPTVRLLDDPP